MVIASHASELRFHEPEGLGMVTMNDHLLDLVEKKLVEPGEAYMKAVEKTQLLKDMQARGFNTSFLNA